MSLRIWTWKFTRSYSGEILMIFSYQSNIALESFYAIPDDFKNILKIDKEAEECNFFGFFAIFVDNAQKKGKINAERVKTDGLR